MRKRTMQTLYLFLETQYIPVLYVVISRCPTCCTGLGFVNEERPIMVQDRIEVREVDDTIAWGGCVRLTENMPCLSALEGFFGQL